MAPRWIEDDPLDGDDGLLGEPRERARLPGVAPVLGLGSVVSMLLLVLGAIAILD